jgi:hypothetical protein
MLVCTGPWIRLLAFEAADEDDLLQHPEQLVFRLLFPVGILRLDFPQRRGGAVFDAFHAGDFR